MKYYGDLSGTVTVLLQLRRTDNNWLLGESYLDEGKARLQELMADANRGAEAAEDDAMVDRMCEEAVKVAPMSPAEEAQDLVRLALRLMTAEGAIDKTNSHSSAALMQLAEAFKSLSWLLQNEQYLKCQLARQEKLDADLEELAAETPEQAQEATRSIEEMMKGYRLDFPSQAAVGSDAPDKSATIGFPGAVARQP